MLERVISGGQDGMDLAALKAARVAGLETGGFMPSGFLTVSGPKPEYGRWFGMEECTSEDYPTRTRLNVQEADATLLIGTDLRSRGSHCTRNAARSLRRPLLEVALGGPLCLDDMARFIIENRVRVLNVAGNRDLGAWQRPAEMLLTGLFRRVRELEEASPAAPGGEE